MRTLSTVAVALVAGAVIGGAAVQSIRAEGKPPAYVIVAIQKINDPEGMKALAEKASAAALASAGGHYVVRTNDVTAFEGAAPKRFVVIGFDSAEKAQAWHDSAGYKEIQAIRAKSTDSVSYMVEGLAN
jgi:uncharacterized protein (DUF1330 family)